ncbi:inner membrane protein YpjD [Litchfieldella qijiaojingensis]|uniref:Inner membrane protein YpjD n=1 Tax=Litchfieldella qijiaojingensis TaxID=980347 RepID=A0ABQ2ZCC6_9GAMM|nr:cytochrome c biogenesis protein CcsA [Halomonas qijiaojingensis]GGY08195.1 inner membrane protein YpjD [Halomonas qijiaojingensis]
MQALPFALLAIIFYLGAASWQGLALSRRVPQRPLLVRGIGLLALVCHALTIIAILREAGGLELGLSSSAVLASAVIAALLLAVSLVKPVLNASVGLFPLAAITLVLAMGLPDSTRDTGLPPGIAFHIISSALAFSLFAIAAVQAVLLAAQNQALRHHHTRGIVQSLPPLTTMERVLFELIWAGMLLLTASIISGLVFLDDLFAQHLAHKTILSLAAWAIFSALLAGHHWLGWRGLRAVRWTLGGSLLLVLAYFGSKFALEVIFQSG